ncbi:MAG: type II secretion system minor pseudopilin GspI [Pseudomonadota bacterium]
MTTPNHKRRNGMMKQTSKKGFTLLEVMIAMAILAIALVAVFQSQSQSISIAGNARFLTTASLLAQSKMAEMEATDMRNIKSEAGNFGQDFPDYEWQMTVKRMDIETVKKIELVVTNNRMRLNHTYMLEYFRFAPK